MTTTPEQEQPLKPEVAALAARAAELEARVEAVIAVRTGAFDTGRDCETCGGSGRVYPGRQIVHVQAGGWLGADWDVDEAHALVADPKNKVEWVRGVADHDLLVTMPDGKTRALQVKRPEPQAQS